MRSLLLSLCELAVKSFFDFAGSALARRCQEFLYTSLLMPSLQSAIERLATLGEVERNPDARQTFFDFREQLTRGKIRAAEKVAASVMIEREGVAGGKHD